MSSPEKPAFALELPTSITIVASSSPRVTMLPSLNALTVVLLGEKKAQARKIGKILETPRSHLSPPRVSTHAGSMRVWFHSRTNGSDDVTSARIALWDRHLTTARLVCLSSLLLIVGMRTGLGLVAALALVVHSVRGWLCALRPHRGGARITRTRIKMSSHTQVVNVEELWPHLAGKRTSASDATGKVKGYNSAWMSGSVRAKSAVQKEAFYCCRLNSVQMRLGSANHTSHPIPPPRYHAACIVPLVVAAVRLFALDPNSVHEYGQVGGRPSA